MENSAKNNKNTADKSKEMIEGGYGFENLSKGSKDLIKQIEQLANKIAPEDFEWMSVDAEERLIHKLKDMGVALEFYTLTSEERNAADVLASTGEVKLYRNNIGNLELSYKEPGPIEKISSALFSTKSA